MTTDQVPNNLENMKVRIKSHQKKNMEYLLENKKINFMMSRNYSSALIVSRTIRMSILADVLRTELMD